MFLRHASMQDIAACHFCCGHYTHFLCQENARMYIHMYTQVGCFNSPFRECSDLEKGETELTLMINAHRRSLRLTRAPHLLTKCTLIRTQLITCQLLLQVFTSFLHLFHLLTMLLLQLTNMLLQTSLSIINYSLHQRHRHSNSSSDQKQRSVGLPCLPV